MAASTIKVGDLEFRHVEFYVCPMCVKVVPEPRILAHANDHKDETNGDGVEYRETIPCGYNSDDN